MFKRKLVSPESPVVSEGKDELKSSFATPPGNTQPKRAKTTLKKKEKTQFVTISGLEHSFCARRNKGNLFINKNSNEVISLSMLLEEAKKGYSASSEKVNYLFDLCFGGVTPALLPYLQAAHKARGKKESTTYEGTPLEDFYLQCRKYKDTPGTHLFVITPILAAKLNLLDILQQDSIITYQMNNETQAHRSQFTTTVGENNKIHSSPWIEITETDTFFYFRFKQKNELNLDDVLSPASKAHFLIKPALTGCERNEFFRIAEALQESRQLKKAATIYGKIIHSDPDYAPAFYKIGLMLKQLNRFSLSLINLLKAERLFVKYLALAPTRVSPKRTSMMDSLAMIREEIREVQAKLAPVAAASSSNSSSSSSSSSTSNHSGVPDAAPAASTTHVLAMMGVRLETLSIPAEVVVETPSANSTVSAAVLIPAPSTTSHTVVQPSVRKAR